MPAIATRSLHWLHIEKRHIYAVGSSMGGQETLLLVAQHPRLLAAAAALDSATDMKARYVAFPRLRGGKHLQALARTEIGGTPLSNSAAYSQRSPIAYARQIAHSPTRLLIWWSTRDQIVRHQAQESGALYRAIVAVSPRRNVSEHIGSWAHSREFYATAQLPSVLVRLGLIELSQPPPRTAL
jgi:pimeloyl-ACP methyl ester carboxylesterase